MSVAHEARAQSDDAHVASYEELRNRALAGSAHGHHLALLLREGMAAWMAQSSPRVATVTPLADRQRRGTQPDTAEETNAGIVRVLASMALAGREGASA